MENKTLKMCPMPRTIPNACKEEGCAWWCEWDKCCALVAIAAELSDRLSEIAVKID